MKFGTIFLKFWKLASNYITKLSIYARHNYESFENFGTMLLTIFNFFKIFCRKKQLGNNWMVCQLRSLNVSALNHWTVPKRRKVAVLVGSHFVWDDRFRKRFETFSIKNKTSKSFLFLSAKKKYWFVQTLSSFFHLLYLLVSRLTNIPI